MKIENIQKNKKINFDPELIKKIKLLTLEKMEKPNPHKYDLRKFIGIIDSEEESDSVKEHDLIEL